VDLLSLSRKLQGKLVGEPTLPVDGVIPLDTDGTGQGKIAFVLDEKHTRLASKSKASALVSATELPDIPVQIIVKNPRKALATALHLLHKVPSAPEFSGPTCIHLRAKVAKTATVSAFCSIGKNSRIDAHSFLHPQVHIGENCHIGKNCVLYPHVILYNNVTIGDNTILHAGCVIGADGFGYYREKSTWEKIPQIGSVFIGDNVEIGANTCIDRACLGETYIKSGCKIDNLVQIGHNGQIEENCVIVSSTAIAGSVSIGKETVIGGQVGFADGITISPRTTIASRAGVTKSIKKENLIVSGFPAQEHKKELKMQATLKQIIKSYKKETK